MMMMTPERSIITSWQMWQHLLCRDCEQLISKRGEDYVSRPDFPLLEKLDVALHYTKEPNLVAYSGSAMQQRLKFAQFACTVPTQPKIATLSAIKTIRYKSFITRSG